MWSRSPRAKRRRIGTARRGRQSDSCAYDDVTQSGLAASAWGRRPRPLTRPGSPTEPMLSGDPSDYGEPAALASRLESRLVKALSERATGIDRGKD
jgi:hypothetical protein